MSALFVGVGVPNVHVNRLALDGQLLRKLAGGKVTILDEVDSTNVWMLAAKDRRSGDAVIARRQWAGKGRSGRTWHSSSQASLYLSCYWRFDRGAALDGLSLAIGVGVVRALSDIGLDRAKLKWPNDVMVDHRKLGGLLVEVTSDGEGLHVVGGIGINGVLTDEQGSVIDQAWTDLDRVMMTPWSMTALSSAVLQRTREVMSDFAVTGLSPFLGEWNHVDELVGCDLRVTCGRESLAGRHAGIDASGALLIETPEGVVRHRVGDVSVRRA